MRWTRAVMLLLTLSLAPAACQPPKFSAGSVGSSITPQDQTPPPPDTVVVASRQKKSSFGDIVLIYAVAFVILAALYFKIFATDAH